MGFFSGKTIVTVGTFANRAIEDKFIPKSTRSGTITALIQDADIVENVLEKIIKSVGATGEHVYRFGKNDYIHGLPSGNFKSNNEGLPQVQAVLNTLEGATVDITYSNYSQPNFLHIAWMKLISDYGYNAVTNEITDLSTTYGHPVYLVDLTVKVPASNLFTLLASQQWGVSPSSGFTPDRPYANIIGNLSPFNLFGTDPVSSDVYVKVDYSYVIPQIVDDPLTTGVVETAPAETITGTFNLLVDGYDEDKDYFHVMYSVGGVIKYWMYQAGLGTYPTLDTVFELPPDSNGEFFPIIYFRHNKISEITNPTSESYKDNRKLIKILSGKYDDIVNAIDENPDIAHVEQAVMNFSVPAVSTNQIEAKYLHAFFKKMFDSDLNKYTDVNFAKINNIISLISTIFNLFSPKITNLIIQDTRFKTVLRQSGITKRIRVMNIGAIGTYSATVEGVHNKSLFSSSNSTHIYRKQISNILCEEIRVVNLELVYYILGSYQVTADEFDPILLIPLDHSITNEFSILEKEELYSRSLHYVFNSAVFTKLKWYQTGIFQIIMIVVAIAITVFSGGADGGQSLWAALGAGGAIAAEAIHAIVMKILWSIVIQIGLKIFVKVFGIKIAFIAAIIVAIYTGFKYISDYGKELVKGVYTAADFFKIALGLTDSIAKQMSEDLVDLYKEFEVYVSEGDERLEAGRKLLSSTVRLDPFVIFGESSDEYYNRTVHSGNIGILSLDTVGSYVDIALMLPKISSTIGELDHGSI